MRKVSLFLLVSMVIVVFSYSQSITVTNPRSGDVWYKGQRYTIRWIKSGSMDSQVKITLYKPDHTTLQTVIVRPTANNGSYSWTVPDSIPNGQYIVRVKTMDNAVYDDGDVFTITNAPVQTARITVTKPHSGQTWYKGQTYTISWTKSGSMDSQVKITLYKPDHTTLQTIIVRPTANDGSYYWTIPDSIPAGQYIVRVKTMDNAVYDDSDVFRIENMNLTFNQNMNKALSKEGLISGVRKVKLLPDLMVYGEKLYYVDLEQHVAKFHAAIKNIGKSDAKNVLVRLRVHPQDSSGRILMSQVATYKKTFRSIPVGMTAVFEQTYKLKTMGLTYYFIFEVNPDHNIEESNYNNNSTKKSIIRENLPDLVTWIVTPKHSVWIESAVVARVKNIGKKRSAPTRLKFYIETKGTKYYDIPALDPGQYVDITRKEWFHSAKDVWAELWVDPDNLVREDHENNHYKIKLNIKWQDLF